jgi:outer membrane protein assembly factor BamB
MKSYRWLGLAGLCAVALVASVIRAQSAASQIETLIAELSSDAYPRRVAAADALARLGPQAKSAIEPLLGAMTDKESWVDFAMMDTLSAIGTTAVPVLVEKFAQGDKTIRIRAGKALWGMGEKAKDAIPAIKKIAADPDADVGKLAAAIIAKIQSELDEAEAARGNIRSKIKVPPVSIAGKTAGRDWPAFHGINRDSICLERGLLKQWPKEGPRLLWKLENLGKGLATVSISGGRIFTMGDGAVEGQAEVQFVLAYDLATRKRLWATPVGARYADYGALCTPTVDDDRLYLTTTDGDVLCLEAASGTVKWRRSFPGDFGGQIMGRWKYSESPLVDGDKVICTPGGKEAIMAALDKRSGQTLWKTALPSLGPKGKDGAAYSSPVVADIGGTRQYIQLVGRGLIGVDAATGHFLWGYNRIANDIANITHPLVRGDFVFVANGYNTGGSLLRIRRQGDRFNAEEVYFLTAKQFQNHHGGIVLLGDYVYGGSGLNRGEPTCVNVATGETLWKEPPLSAGSAAVLYADGHLVFRYDRGLVALVEATPKEFRLKGQFTPLTADGPAWAHPVIHAQKLYLRHNNLLACYDLNDQ